jgi:hypothetical protein
MWGDREGGRKGVGKGEGIIRRGGEGRGLGQSRREKEWWEGD